jgi:hypothetical protein
MGRPLFSQIYTSAPAVRVEPEPSVSPYEKWTYWNPFDPDSEEFFENDPVYEAFIEAPSSLEEEQREVVHIPEGSDSSTSSEGSVSERGSPMAVGSDDPITMIADAYPNAAFSWGRAPPPPHNNSNSNTASSDNRPPADFLSQFASTFNVVPDSETRVLVRGNRQRSATITVLPHRRFTSSFQNSFEGLPRTSNITPITIPSSRTVIHNNPSHAPQPSFSPSTSPSESTPSPTPSPPLTPVIPVLVPSEPPVSGSPSYPTPLTNPNARISFADIAPMLVRIRDVA